MRQEAYFCTVKELDELGKNNIPRQLISHTHLIYSSPATLAFNSPGAEGFGVKRAGLAVPDSVMLIVSPGCCGRNTSVLSSMRAYPATVGTLPDMCFDRRICDVTRQVIDIAWQQILYDLTGQIIFHVCSAPFAGAPCRDKTSRAPSFHSVP